MKKIVMLFMLLLSPLAVSSESFSGSVELVEPEREKITINGSEYRVAGDVSVLVGEHDVGIDQVKAGMTVSYTLEFIAGTKQVDTIRLQLTDEQVKEMFNH